MKFLVTACVLLFVHKIQCVNVKVDPLVYTDQGLVRGQKATDGDYAYFLGIPYAKVDMENPFGPVLPHPGFGNQIFNAYDGSKNCPQPEYSYDHHFENQDLDCLILNVFTPNSASTRNPLPVLVYVHGGGFYAGSIEEYGIPNVVKEGVVVVLMNYRLGPYGFMCVDSPLAPGNQGLKDQYEALLWVKRNIAAFGGNPYNITLGGPSAGSASVLLHLYSSRAKLYNKVIAQSGAGLERIDSGDNDAIKLAEHLGFNTTDTEQALKFLSATSHDLVIGAVTDLGIVTRPCAERFYSDIEPFVTADFFSLSNERKVRNTPILIGNTDVEYQTYSNTADGDCGGDVFYCTILSNFNMEESMAREAADIIRHFYLGDTSLTLDIESELGKFMTDFEFNHPIQRAIDNLVSENANPVYEYVFSYGETGAKHSDDLIYLFENDYDTDEKKMVSQRLTKLYANFIKYANPTPEVTELLPITWEPITEDKRPYLDINTELRMKSRFNNERMAFWDLFYTVYGGYKKVANAWLENS